MGKDRVTARSVRPLAPSRIVGVGASAGGLEALERLCAELPVSAGLSVVVVQHLPRGGGGGLRALVQGFTRMPVVQVTDRLAVLRDHVYVAPAGAMVRVTGRQFRVRPMDDDDLHPIDHLLTSIARNAGPRAAGIILSGAGTDGTAGIRSLRRAGGLCLAQEPSSAGFEGMPRSAIETGAVHVVAAPEAMGRELVGEPAHDRRAPATSGSPLARILELVRGRTGHDFTMYKRATLRRRLGRRMAAVGAADPGAYAKVLAARPEESGKLVAELLIGVTQFFRDPQAWKALRNGPLGQLLRRDREAPVRIWVAGCSSGQEAYSMAMLVDDIRTRTGCPAPVQILATDLDTRALAVARRAVYPAASAREVSARFLERYFDRAPEGLRVRPAIRRLVTFARHDLAQDPPYSRLDLICCRNVLIYFETALQTRIIPLLHFALMPDGCLFLGPSESVGPDSRLFQPLDRAARLFVCRSAESPRRVHTAFPGHRGAAARWQDASSSLERDPGRTEAVAMRLLNQTRARASVLVDENGRVVYTAGELAQFLTRRPLPGVVRLPGLLRAPLRRPMTDALRRAEPGGDFQRTAPVALTRRRGAPRVAVAVRTLRAPAALSGWSLVTFEDDAARSRVGKRRGSSSLADRLGEQLRAARGDLELAHTELQTCAELRNIVDEEAQSSTEELRSTNEELQTTKEELLVVNETVAVLNVALQAKVQELSRFNDDLAHLLAGSRIATIYLDEAARIQRFTPATSDLVPLIPADLGRPIVDVAAGPSLAGIADDCRLAARQAAPVTREVRSRDGRWFLRRLHREPGKGDGDPSLILTFGEITDQKQRQDRLHALSNLLESDGRSVLIADADGRIDHASAGLARRLGVDAATLAGSALDRIRFPGHQRKWHLALHHAVLQGQEWTTEEQVPGADGELRWESAQLSPLRDPAGTRLGSLLILDDVSQRRRATDQAAGTARVAATLAAWGATVLRAHGPNEALHAAARTLVRHGGYRASWACRVDPRSRQVLAPVARAGRWSGSAPDAPPAPGAVRWRTLAGRALDESIPALRDRAPARGDTAGRHAVMPIRESGATVGLLGLRCEGTGALLEPELKLLANLADSLGPMLVMPGGESR